MVSESASRWAIPNRDTGLARRQVLGRAKITGSQTTRSSGLRVTEIIADLHVTDLEAAKGVYTDYLGLTAEEFNLGWVARYTSPQSGINIQLMTRDATAPEDPVISVRVDDIEAAFRPGAGAGLRILPMRGVARSSG